MPDRFRLREIVDVKVGPLRTLSLNPCRACGHAPILSVVDVPEMQKDALQVIVECRSRRCCPKGESQNKTPFKDMAEVEAVISLWNKSNPPVRFHVFNDLPKRPLPGDEKDGR